MRFIIAFACCLVAITLPIISAQTITTPSAIGVFGQLLENFTNRGNAISDNFDNQAHLLGVKLLERVRLGGGSFGNLQDYANLVREDRDILWTTVAHNMLDLSWEFRPVYDAAIDNIVREFRLVIDQPQVRSWLRELRDLRRTSVNEALQSVKIRHDQWWSLVQQYEMELIDLVNRGRCQQDPQRVEQSFERILKIAYDDVWQIFVQLKADNVKIMNDFVQRGYELTRKIYEAEVEALRYFVT